MQAHRHTDTYVETHSYRHVTTWAYTHINVQVPVFVKTALVTSVKLS